MVSSCDNIFVVFFELPKVMLHIFTGFFFLLLFFFYFVVVGREKNSTNQLRMNEEWTPKKKLAQTHTITSKIRRHVRMDTYHLCLCYDMQFFRSLRWYVYVFCVSSIKKNSSWRLRAIFFWFVIVFVALVPFCFLSRMGISFKRALSF